MSSTRECQEDNNKKRPITYFDIWEPWRDSVIEHHRFYTEQGKIKLLSQFSNMEQEADEAAESWLVKRSMYFDPDHDDAGNLEEDAYHEGIEYYRLLSALRDQTRLGIVAGMYHAWDKELRRWLVREIEHWHRGRAVSEKVWKATFEEIFELLVSTGLTSYNTDHFEKLTACRCVVNVYKHGEGCSFDKLKANYPEYLNIQSANESLPNIGWVDHTHLMVTDEQFDEFSCAIIQFWRAIPSRVSSETLNVPKWFEKAMDSDHKKTRS